MSLEVIIFYLLLVDSVVANLMVWFGAGWYRSHLGIFVRHFPPAKGWALIYLALVIWIGTMVM